MCNALTTPSARALGATGYATMPRDLAGPISFAVRPDRVSLCRFDSPCIACEC